MQRRRNGWAVVVIKAFREKKENAQEKKEKDKKNGQNHIYTIVW